MAMFNKETALEIAYIGAGAVAGKIAENQVYGLLPSAVTSKLPAGSEDYVKGAIPVAIGLFLPSIAGSSKLVRGLANGMIAAGGSTIVGKLLGSAGVPVAGVGNVMMGNVMMGQASYGDDSLIMGTDGDSNYSDTSYDLTSSDTGEMDY